MKSDRLHLPSINGPLGTTLSEVLVSLLIMSIGVVSLATLFPISVLRAVQATQLTNAANLRYNVEALLGPRPQLYSVGQSWVAGTTYAAGAFVTPTELTSLKSPPCVFVCATAGIAGTYEPNWQFNNLANTNDGTVVWTTYLLQNYVVDPLGEVLVESAYRRTANGDYIGNYGGSPPTVRQTIRAFSGFSSTPTEAMADDMATLPDSWIGQVDSNLVSGTTITSCILGDIQSNIVIPTSTDAYPPSRIVMFDITGKISHVRPIYTFSGAVPTVTVDWTPPAGVLSAGPLPLNFTPVRARIEIRERRYTWMLSVRRAFSGVSYMDVVVFFRRPMSGKDEQLYPATFTSTTDFGADGAPGVQGYDDDGNHVTDDLSETGFPGSDDVQRNWVVVQYDATGDKPFVKKGGFVTDADNLQWYRIVDVIEGDLINGFSPGVVMTMAGLNITLPQYTPDASAFASTKAIFLRVDVPIAQSGGQPTGGAGGVPTGFAMMMRGIVDVYPIRTHLTWGN